MPDLHDGDMAAPDFDKQLRPKALTRTFAIASLGGMLEFYDFVIFVFFTEAIGKAFFPAATPDWLKQTEVLGLFAAGYLARPLGGIVMAHFGDLTGRKRVFMLAVLMMAVPTFVIGCLPTFAQIGYVAPFLLLACRVLQGAAVGGEVPGAWVFVSEHAPATRVGFACGLLTAGLTAGIFLGSAVNLGLTLAFPSQAITQWAWRLPFLLGGVLGLMGMALRSRLVETPVFEALRREHRLAKELPLKTALRDHLRAVLVSMMATWFLTAVIVVLTLLAPTLLRHDPRYDSAQIAVAALAETAALAVSCAVCGAAIDRFGLKPIVAIAIAAIVAAAYLLFTGAAGPGATMAVFAVVGAAAGLIVFVPVVMVNAFPAELAFSGVSSSYNAAYAIAGGLTPPLVGLLFHQHPMAPAHYVAAVCIVSGATVLAWLGSDGNILARYRPAAPSMR